MIQTTWEFIACANADPACVLCGHLSAPKRMSMEVVREILHDAPACDNISAATLQICKGLAAEGDDGNVAVPTCASCHHWMARHRHHKATPLLTLRLFIHKLHTPHTNALDSRVVVRLAKTLAHQVDSMHNYYMTLFSPAEQKLLRAIATTTPRGARRLVARFYMQSNINTIYVSTAHASEFLRENLGE